MARQRNPLRDKAKQIWLESNGETPLVDIAIELDKSSSTIRKWKSTDKWDDELKGSAPLNKRSAPLRNNQNTIENKGGAPPNNQNANLSKIVRNVKLRSSNGSDWNISNHLNSASPQATGVEVFYFGGDLVAKAKAEQISAAISRTLGIPNRGAKDGSGLYVIRNTPGHSLLIEWSFISNPNDMIKLLGNMDQAVNEVVKLFGYGATEPIVPTAPTKVNMQRAAIKNLSPHSASVLKTRFIQEFGPQGKHIVSEEDITINYRDGGSSAIVMMNNVSEGVANWLRSIWTIQYVSGEKLIDDSSVYVEPTIDPVFDVEFKGLNLNDARNIRNELRRDFGSAGVRYMQNHEFIVDGSGKVVIKNISYPNARELVRQFQDEYAINRKLLPVSSIQGVKQ
ncbi:phage terminase small subunit-related protein [Carnobacterium divergens]|uniref:phage terminase small subunit-related protein n=1 Tax=Carnobacterium divergens TaxID=2748 RepID=UPI0028906E7E|nr:phage terminase small subunit-related protein [Carnobacterium divergens]MDT2010680.1 phage terminase small subunit-related protein [Carnobacterium divergens]